MLHLQAKRQLFQQMPQKAKNLVTILVSSILMTEKKGELKWVLSFKYPVTFKKQIKVLLDSGSEVNVMSQSFALKLEFKK